MPDTEKLKLLFVINNNSGTNTTNWHKVIGDYFRQTAHTIKYFEIPQDCNSSHIQKEIDSCKPDIAIAVGGDGTVKLVAESILYTGIPLGILPAGSANGMAKELNISNDANVALNVIIQNNQKRIHLLSINDELCIHLSDIGFNAFMIREFEQFSSRGMWGYMKAAFSIITRHRRMQVEINTQHTSGKKTAAMVVIANATKYGTGALINPEGSLEDDKFEVIVLKKISVREIIKMMFTHKQYDPAKTEVFQTQDLTLYSHSSMHFQVDGEYMGKTNKIRATIMPGILKVIVPPEP